MLPLAFDQTALETWMSSRELKPTPAFFKACVDRVASAPGSCIFIDDALANVEGARASGLQAVHYRDTPSLIAELRRLGVEVPDIES